MPLKRIVAVLEPYEEEQPALQRALVLARRARARLELQAVDVEAPSRARVAGGPEVAHDLAHWLDAVREGLPAEGLDVATIPSYGRPCHKPVIEHALAEAPDLMVKATRFHAPLERNYFAASDWRLIAACPVPLLLVKRDQVLQPGPVIAAVDPLHAHDEPAELDRRILDIGTVVARLLERNLLVVHAVSVGTMLPVVGDAYLGRVAAETRRLNEHLEAVRNLAHPYGIAPEALDVEAGTPDQVIAAVAARERAAVVVMGAVSRSSVTEMLIGNTAERVLEDVVSDLLVVPTKPA